MPTSMLDALADEAKAVTEIGIAASRLAIEAVHRSRQLHIQIEHLAAAERADVIQDAPGNPPAAQDSGQGKEGSGEVAPGGATALRLAESEQAVADAASGEQGSDAVCKDPEAAPDTRTKKDRVLDLYAASDQSMRSIAREVGVPYSSMESYIHSARRASDRRVAQGDVLREKEIVPLVAPPKPAPPKPFRVVPVPFERATKLVPAALQEPEQKPALTMPLDEDPKEGKLLALNLDKCTAAFRGQGIQLVRHELRMLLLLNDRHPKPAEAMLAACGALTRRRLIAEIGKLNDRIALIGVAICDLGNDTFALDPIQGA